jgi:hypothetical protein
MAFRPTGHAAGGNRCTYETCASDTDCASGSLCMCGTSGDRSYCASANCHDSTECASGRSCAEVPPDSATGGGRYCTTSSDTCHEASDCGSGKTCGYSTSRRRWECVATVPRPVG